MPPRELKRPPLVSQKSVPIGHTVPTGLRHTARTTSHCLSPRLLVTGLQSRRLFGRRFRGRMTGPENGVFQLRAYEINLCNEGQRRKIRITTSYVLVEDLPRRTVNCKTSHQDTNVKKNTSRESEFLFATSYVNGSSNRRRLPRSIYGSTRPFSSDCYLSYGAKCTLILRHYHRLRRSLP